MVGMRREGETGRIRQRERGCSPSCPDSSSLGPQRRKGTDRELRTGPRDAAFSVFPHVLRPPSPHLEVSRLPRPPPARQGLSQGPSSGSPPPLLAPNRRGPGIPTPHRPSLRRPERASPGQGWAGGADAQGACKRGRETWMEDGSPELPRASSD